jgi:NosR/NirI family transcriptional regulator, nitrous oxide reductase regulator
VNRPAAARLLVLTFLAFIVSVALARAQAPATSPDPWGFDDEVKVETWADILRPQAVDIALTAGLIGFALFSFSKRSKALKYTTLVFTLAYLGVMKSTMISVTDIFRIVDLNLPEFKYSVYWYMFAGFAVVSTVVWGRLYCGRLCAFGAFTQLLDAVVPSRLRIEPPLWLERRASYVKYGLLVAVVAFYVATKQTSVYRYVEPFWMFTRTATPLLWSMLAVLLLATLVVRNLYCRFLCPVGAMLGIISQVTTALPIKRWSECKTCKICERACEWGAIQGPKIIKSECVRCDDCERIYADKKACVHWLMIVKKERWAREGIKVTT